MDDQAAPEYLFNILQSALSITEASACSVEPGSSEDVIKVIWSGAPALGDPHFQATYPGINPNALRRERWRTHRKPGVFLDERGTDCDVTRQRDKSQFLEWDS
jgi:hypothetical protein